MAQRHGYISRSSVDLRWRNLAARFKIQCHKVNAPCHLCVLRGDRADAVIDYRAKPGSPNGFAADHINTWDAFSELRYEWANLAASHDRCNKQRGNITLEQYVERYRSQDTWVAPQW